MASTKILNAKKEVVNEIADKIKNSESVVLFSYQGLTVADMAELRNKVKEANGEVKIYKNTLVKRATDELNIDLSDTLEGPNAIVFGKELLAPIKAISAFTKDHKCAEIRSGIINGEVATIDEINEYATIPSMEGLLTMLAGGMIEHVKNLSIALNLYAEGLEEK
ncbi:MAG: 50S ribosomal protein L10 [Bacilli bacterium]|nr:50S ribosomal protein L10 [Bacilli bacterium]MCI6932489.1 50S ribosomal protein L10 [Mycoplasmatota bacterium]